MRIILLFCLGVFLCSFSANASERPKIVTTFTILADMARNVGGDMVEVVSITKPGAEIHNYQPTPKGKFIFGH